LKMFVLKNDETMRGKIPFGPMDGNGGEESWYFTMDFFHPRSNLFPKKDKGFLRILVQILNVSMEILGCQRDPPSDRFNLNIR
jgi:hypothetical protein